MKLSFSKYVVILVFMALLPSSLFADVDEAQIAGIYKSKVEDKSFVVLHLNPDKTAIIESVFWYSDTPKDRRTKTYNAIWKLHCNEIAVTYNDIVQLLTYHDQLNLEEYGIQDSVPGLTTSENNRDNGLLDSIILWKRDELSNVTREKEITVDHKTLREYFTWIDLSVVILVVVFISAFVGYKKPLRGGVIGAFALPCLCYVFLFTNAVFLLLSGVIGLFIGIIAALISSILISGMMGKGHNTGPSFMSGFGGGRGGAPPGGIILSDEERKHKLKP